MRLKKLLYGCYFATLLSTYAIAQTSLSEGDIAITGLNGQGSNDFFSFVTFVELEAGTEIHFADETTSNGTSLNNSVLGGVIKYTVPAGGIGAGEVIEFNLANPDAEFTIVEAPTFSANGDKLNAFQGYNSSNRAVTTWLFTLESTAEGQTFPGGYTSIVVLGGEDGEYNGGRNGIKDDLLSNTLNVVDWIVGDDVYSGNLTEFNVGYYWDGSTWTPSDPGGVGSAFDDDVIIAGSGATFSGNVTTNNDVTIDAGATLDLGANTLTADSVFILSDATGQGQVKGSVTGNVEFQSYISGSARWFNFGSPVDGPLSLIEITNGGVIQTAADGPTANANIYYYAPATLNGSTSEGTWTVAADKTPAANANGWSVYLGGGGAFGTLPMTISSFGSLDADGFVTTSLSDANGGWNFVNNPFPATLDWDAVEASNSGLIATTYFIYDGSGWRGYNAIGGAPPTGTQVTQYISAGQAFFVQAASSTASMDFDLSHVDMTGSTGLYRSVPNPGVYLMVTSSADAYDYTYLGLKQGAVMGFDNVIDARKKKNNASITPNLFTSVNGEAFMFNFVENTTGSLSIPVNLEFGIDDELTITPDIRSIDASTSVMLEDKLSGDMIDLRQQSYTFRHLAANDPDRFVLHLSQNSVGMGAQDLGKDGIFSYVENQTLFINLESLTANASAHLYDMSGKLILNQQVSAGEVAEMALPASGAGVYLLKLIVDGQVLHTQKIMK